MKNLLILALVLIVSSCQPTEKQSNSETISSTQSNKQTSNLLSFIGKDYLIDDQHSYVGFKIKYFGYSPVRGRFNVFDGTLFYDEDDLTSLSVTLVIDINSINTGNERRDDDLKREGTWFDAVNYPTIVFRSQAVELLESGGFNLLGTLTMKGVSKDISVAFESPTSLSKDWAGNDQVDFSGQVTLDRQEFGIYGGDFWSSVMENGLTQLSDEVVIELDIHCRRADYQARFDDADSLDVGKLILEKFKANKTNEALNMLDSLHTLEQISSGKISTIAYTLNTWRKHDEAITVFKRRLKYYPDRISTLNQLGITEVLKNNYDSASTYFNQALRSDSLDTRAMEYIKLLNLINKQPNS